MTKRTVLIDREMYQCQTELSILQADAGEQTLRNTCKREVWNPAPNYQKNIEKQNEIVVENAKVDKRYVSYKTLKAILGKRMSDLVTNGSSIYFPVKMKLDQTYKKPIQIEINSEITLPIIELIPENYKSWWEIYGDICDKHVMTIQAAMLLMYEYQDQLAFQLILTIEISQASDSTHKCPVLIVKTPNRPTQERKAVLAFSDVFSPLRCSQIAKQIGGVLYISGNHDIIEKCNVVVVFEVDETLQELTIYAIQYENRKTSLPCNAITNDLKKYWYRLYTNQSTQLCLQYEDDKHFAINLDKFDRSNTNRINFTVPDYK
jgi:hypothetical protein